MARNIFFGTMQDLIWIQFELDLAGLCSLLIWKIELDWCRSPLANHSWIGRDVKESYENCFFKSRVNKGQYKFTHYVPQVLLIYRYVNIGTSFSHLIFKSILYFFGTFFLTYYSSEFNARKSELFAGMCRKLKSLILWAQNLVNMKV